MSMPRTPALALALLAALAASCAREPDVVVYVSLDQDFSEALIERFERESGLDVEAIYDVEAQKTVGHVEAIRARRDNPHADVFWNNEIANTVALANEGLLQPYASPSAADIPAPFRDPQNLWTGFAARARVYIVNTDKADPSAITSMWDLVDPEHAGEGVIARPLTGTTLTHVAALYSVLGEERAEEYLQAIVAGNKAGTVHVAKSNGQTMRMAREGDVTFGWTDTDDFNVAKTENFPVVAVFPDQGPDGVGTLVIPNTVAMLAGAPHPEAAKRLIDFLLSKEVERELAFSRSAQIPVRPDVERPEGMVDLSELKLMDVDFVKVGADLPRLNARLQELFLD